MIALDVNTQVESNVIGNAEFISIGVEHVFGIVELVVSYRKSYGSSCLIHKVHRKAVAPGQFIVGNHTEIMGLVVVWREELSIVHPLFIELAVEFDERARICIADPSV